jgi:RloB-like protein
MPRERTEFIRISNVKERDKMFLLAYEGNETEPTYFEALKKDYRFNNEIIEIVSLRRNKDDTKSAPKYVFENLQRIKQEYDLANSDELWMIIDRDRNGKNIERYNQKCNEESNFYLALSNPCFEFWLLLHLKDLSEFNQEELILIFENKKINKSRRTYLKSLLSKILPDGYNESNLKPERFLPNLEIAIKRAKALSKNEEYPISLGTDIHKLIQKIIK